MPPFISSLTKILLKKVQLANPDAVIKCISKQGKSETLSCSDPAGNEMSQSTGKEKKLTKWVTSKKCAVKSECKNIQKVQSKNTNVKITCINDMGKTKVMSCSDLNGKLLSTKSGAMKDLIKWVQSSLCTPMSADPVCNCKQAVAHYLNIKCVENNVWSCSKPNKKTGTYKAKNNKKCDKLRTKIKCSKTA